MRSFVRNPGFTAWCVLSLVAGIGLTAALASVADAILFRPLPVPDAREIVRIYTSSAGQARGFVSFHDFVDFRDQAQTVRAMIAQTQVLVAISRDAGAPAQVRLGLAVTTDYFDALRVHAATGRTFQEQESHSGVVILTDAFWRSEFGADRSLIGRAIRVGGAPFTVLGIAPRDFGLDRFVHESFYVPMEALPGNGHPLEDRGRRFLVIYGRLGANLQLARAEFATLAAGLESSYPETNRGRRATVLTEFEARTQADRTVPALAALLIAMSLLTLTIATANAGGLLLAQAESRAREIAVRMALGATRARLLATSMGQAAILATGGVALGIPMAWAATKLLARVATLPTDFPFAISPRMDARVIAVTAAASAIAVIVCGYAPALAIRGTEIGTALKSAGNGNATGWRNALVAMQVALATGLVATGASLVSSIRSTTRIDPGYRVEHVLTIALDPAQAGYSRDRTRVYYTQLLERVLAVAGVKHAALAQSAVLGYVRVAARVQIAGERETRSMWMNSITPDYFALLRLALVEGRAFDDRDTDTSAPVAIVNQDLEKLCPMGTMIRINGQVARVVGVARNAKYFDIHEAPLPFVYLPYAQSYASRMVLHVETAGDPIHAAPAILKTIRELDASQPVSDIRPLRDYLDQGSMFGTRVAVDAIAMVGACAMALALAGVYGVVAHVAARRRREIGIRMALGATRRGVATMILRHAILLVSLGAAGGLALAVYATRLLAATLDLWGVAGAVAVAAVSLTGAMVPAWRGSAINPAAALRPE